ncbi:glutathione S-transferase [Gallaecimonas kandeliae]|uniref:glutathione S-transferase family protein n=1 Tax=Gallaecimonas kandeliae TaxID=3029055 RepID=UPI00264A4691|nr:glutathione S-transferase family protein [Gallaecimonas kandeliae]WKE65806.1 glutathione S-transferase [Gallaecimonas kandeliae]
MPITLFELAGASPERRFSPYCWRSHLALWHKGLDFQALPWRYNDKALIAASGQGKVPVLVDGDQILHESWDIALYLEDRYPQAPSLFPEGAVQAKAFMNRCDSEFNPAVRWFLLPVIHPLLTPGDQVYFRQSREAQLGMRLEDCSQKADRAALASVLGGFAEQLGSQPFFAGFEPGYSDLSLLGSLLWAAASWDQDPLSDQPVLKAWRARLAARFPGLADYRFQYQL